MVEALRYKLIIFGVPIYGFSDVLYNNEFIYKNTIPIESVLNTEHHSIAYHIHREAVADKTTRIDKQVNDNNLAHLFTNIMIAERKRLLF